MSQPPEFWTTLSANVLVLVVGGGLAVVSYLAARREQERSFAIAALGFGLVTAGTLTLVAYQTTMKRSYVLGGVELLRVQAVQGFLILAGFSALLYSLARY